MQDPSRKPKERKTPDRGSKDEPLPPNSSRRPQDEKPKKTSTPRTANVTPRNYVLKSTAADIYSQKKPSTTLKAPKKAVNKVTALSKASPMRDLLKPSPPVKRTVAITPVVKKRPPSSSNLAKTNTNLGPLNVTVNSPPVKRKLALEEERGQGAVDVGSHTRQRQKTRTLQEDEVKVLTSEAVDNNTEMLKLSKSLKAQSKTFFVDLGDGDKNHPKEPAKSSEDEVSYEDDFESYESDFESYHSGASVRDSDNGGKDSDSGGKHSDSGGKHSDSGGKHSDSGGKHSDSGGKHSDGGSSSDEADERAKDSGSVGRRSDDVTSDSGPEEPGDESEDRSRRDEERMLDSGSYDLRDSQKSAGRRVLLDNIQEDRETGPLQPEGPRGSAKGPGKHSLSDEGFQDMAGGTQLDGLEGPLFIDFAKSKETKRKRRICERLRRRAKDLLSMITLHEMSYSLLELKPIPYDLYMTTFGLSNHVQAAVQTNDDSVHEEVQTDEIFLSQKWTQCPVRFSDKHVYLTRNVEKKVPDKLDEDYLKKFTFLLDTKEDAKSDAEVSDEYLRNPLRIFFEQKDGVGADRMLPSGEYEARLGNTSYSVARLKRFLKKVEGRVTNVLAQNAGVSFSGLEKSSDVPFSNGYTTLKYKNVPDFECLKHRNLTQLVFSETKSNLLMTVHRKATRQPSMERDLVCLWDVNVASGKPLKVLVAIDNIVLCRFRGNTDGVFVSALEDGSIHLWDLSEEATIFKDVASSEQSPIIDVKTEGLCQVEKEREWNVQNSNLETETSLPLLQACAYTSSATNFEEAELTDDVVGLELVSNDHRVSSQDGGRKILGHVCSLQKNGVLTIWMVVQEKKSQDKDLGKAFWSKLKLEKNQSVSLSEYVDLPVKERIEYNFNLTAAKRRILTRKQEKKDLVRPNSSASTNYDRPVSATNVKKTPTTNLTKTKMADKWESGMLCTDLKVCKYNKLDHYLVSKSGGEVLLCTRISGAFKVNRFFVTNERSTVTALAVSGSLPHFLAGTDTGAVMLCTLRGMRVLLTLDCRNVSSCESAAERYQNDLKGRYIGTVAVKPEPAVDISHGGFSRCPITSLQWPADNPCCVTAVTAAGGRAWHLARSDIHARATPARVATALSANTLALVTEDGELQLHRLKSQTGTDHRELFLKYVALL